MRSIEMFDYEKAEDHAGISTLREPRDRALIACQIQTGPGMTWTNRTYEVIRGADGQWRVDFGKGALEPWRDWSAILDWLRSLRPRDLELLEDV
jgi:hypothetical protein